MNCNCLTHQATRIKDGFNSGKIPMPAKATKAVTSSCSQAALNLNSGEIMLGITFDIGFEGLKKPYLVWMTAGFCPFCGVATEKSKAFPTPDDGKAKGQ